jgi:hypothetical protein
LLDDATRLDRLEAAEGAALLSDDFGHWAVSGSGFQNITDGNDATPTEDTPIDIQSTFWVDADEWKGSLREALDTLEEAENAEEIR